MRLRVKPVFRAGFSAAVLVGLTGVTQSFASTYVITNIPTLDPAGEGDIYAQGISSTGEITGYYEQESVHDGPINTAFIASVTGGTVTEQSLWYVGSSLPPSDPDFSVQQSWGLGVNAAGTVVGMNYPGHAYTYTSFADFTSGTMQDLGSPQPSGNNAPDAATFPAAISNSGLIAGAVSILVGGNTTGAGGGVNRIHAFVNNGTVGGFTDLSGASNLVNSAAYGVNSTGTAVVGFETTITTSNQFGQAQSAFSVTNTNDDVGNYKTAAQWTLSNGNWTAQQLTVTLPTQASDPTQQSVAFGINNTGQVVGCAETDLGAGVQGDAFLRQPNGTAVDLTAAITGATGSGIIGNLVSNSGGLYNGGNNFMNSGLGSVTSCADAINDEGEVVGYYTGGGVNHAFLATVNSSNGVTFTDLSTLFESQGWFLNEATGINDAGQIVGYGTMDQVEKAFEITLAVSGVWSSSSSGSWASAANWQGGVPNSVGATASFSNSPGLTSSGTVTLDGNETVGHLILNSNTSSYTINPGAGGTLTIDDTGDLAGATPTIIVSAGTHTINAPISLATNNGSMGVTVNTWAGTSLTIGGPVTAVNGGSGALTAEGGGNLIIAPAGSLSVPLIANGPVIFAANTILSAGILIRTVPSITLASNVTVSVAPALTHASRQLIVTTPVFTPQQVVQYDFDTNANNTIAAWAGQLDLANNDMDVPNGNLSQLTFEVGEGYANGSWIGWNFDQGYTPGATIIYNGIVSTAAAADTTHLTALGVIQNMTAARTTLYSTFDGQPVSSTDVLIKYTYYGDADLNGEVDGSDYSRIDNGYLNNLTGWGNGDFNYDGVINGSDYTLIDNAYNTQGASLAASVATTTAEIAGTSSVPEPATLGVLALAATGLLGRRKRN
jgi:probable HAF family extracellular repeat protein